MKLEDLKKDFKLADLAPYKLFVSHQENLENRRKVIKSFKAKANARRSFSEKFADWMTSKFGSIAFLLLNAVSFIVWIVINTGVTEIEPFDPYPFGMMTTIVSLEAIFLAIVVLISQNREAHIAELREEIELQINTVAEGELTKLISLTVALLEKNGVKVEEDDELREMLKPTDTQKLEEDLTEELR